MNNVRKPNVFRSIQKFVNANSPKILIGTGIALGVGTVVLAVKGTPKALQLIEQKKAEENKEKLTPIEVVKTTWKCYIPATISGVTSIACILSADAKYTKRHAALAAAYKLSETAFNEYHDKVVETIGENKERAIRDEINKERMEKDPVTDHEVILTKQGTTLCLDPTSGRYFESDIHLIRSAENELNSRMLHDMFGYVSLNEFYDEIGLDHTDVGDIVGWNVHNLIKIRTGSAIAKDGRPCIVIEHVHRPEYDYDKVS